MRDVSEVADERRCLLDDAVSIVSSKLSQFQDAYDELEQWQADSKTHHDEIVQHIAASASQLKSLIEQKQQKLSFDVETLFAKRLQLVNDRQAAISDQLPDLQNLLIR